MIWWNGPTWLHHSPEYWPSQSRSYGHQNEAKTTKQVIVTLTTKIANEWYNEFIAKYSSLNKLQRVMGYILRFIYNITKPKKLRINSDQLHREELFQAMTKLCQHEQIKFFAADLEALKSKGEVSKNSTLRSLDPFLDNYGVLRVGERLQNSLAPYSTRHPITSNPELPS